VVLTEQHKQVAELLVRGWSTPRIAREVGVNERKIRRWKNHFEFQEYLRSLGYVAPASQPAETKPKAKLLDPFEREEKTEFWDNGNTATAEWDSASLRTLDDLVAKCNIDLDVWQIERHVINKWAQGSKGRDGEIRVIPLWQVKAWLVRKVAVVTEFPEIRPALFYIGSSTKKTSKLSTNALATALIIPDAHVGYSRDLKSGKLDPFHDRRCWDLIFQIVQDRQPDRIIYLGDNLDLPDFSSKYLTSPEMRFNTQAAIDELGYLLAKVRSLAPHAMQDYIAGNHECFSEDTELLTERGWVGIDEYKPTDRVASYNRYTKQIRFEKALGKIERQFNGELINIQGSHSDLLITEGHRLLWKSSQGKSWKINEVKDIYFGQNRLALPVAGSVVSAENDLSEDEARLTTWLCTDSYITRHGYVVLYQRKSKAHLIRELLDRMRVPYVEKTRYRETTEICGKKLKSDPEPGVEFRVGAEGREVISHLYPKDRNSIPPWVLTASQPLFEAFLSSYIDCDGLRHKSNPSNAWMAYGPGDKMGQLQAACILHGYRASLAEYRSSHFRLNISKGETICLDRSETHLTRVPYKGRVWCLETVDDTVISRRKGKVTIAGNCRLTKAITANLVASYGLKPANQPQFHPVMSIPFLLGLEHLDIQYHGPYPNGEVWLNQELLCIHGTKAKSRSGETGWAILQDASHSTIYGHIHRMEMLYRTSRTRRGIATRVAASPGCICRLDGIVPAQSNFNDWQNGLLWVDYDPDGHQFQISPIHIFEGECLFNQRQLRGEFDIADLRSVTGNDSY